MLKNAEVWIWTDPMQHLDTFPFSAILLWMVCLGLLSCCITQFEPSFSCQIDGLTFDSTVLYAENFMVNLMTAKFPGPVAAKYTSNH